VQWERGFALCLQAFFILLNPRIPQLTCAGASEHLSISSKSGTNCVLWAWQRCDA
jgi:hypothetical protein